jgi:hypothetical protein
MKDLLFKIDYFLLTVVIALLLNEAYEKIRTTFFKTKNTNTVSGGYKVPTNGYFRVSGTMVDQINGPRHFETLQKLPLDKTLRPVFDPFLKKIVLMPTNASVKLESKIKKKTKKKKNVRKKR